MDPRLVTMIVLLRVGAVIALICASVAALLIAGFAMDSPSSTEADALLAVGAILVLTLPVTALPLWAAHRIKRLGASGMTAATVYSILILPFLPFGTIIGCILLVMAWKAKRGAIPIPADSA